MKNKKEFASRRAKVTKALNGSAGIVFAGSADVSLDTSWRPQAHFEYLTGLINERHAMLLFDPTNPAPARREVLFCQTIIQLL